MAAYVQASPNATAIQRANQEAALITGHSSGIAALTAEYESEIRAARDGFDAQLNYARSMAENPVQTTSDR